MGGISSRQNRRRRTAYRSQQPAAGQDEAVEPAPVDFASIAKTLKTGDVCILYRKGMEQPHYAMFVLCDEFDDNPPLLLLKGKTKPLPLEKFEKEQRDVRIISASTRIFYGDYEKVLIRRLKKDKDIPGEQVEEIAEAIRNLKFHENELKIIEDANLSPELRSLHVCTFMLAHVMSQLGQISVEPHTVTPKDFISHLKLDDPISIKLPETRAGPLVSQKSAPFLAKLM